MDVKLEIGQLYPSIISLVSDTDVSLNNVDILTEISRRSNIEQISDWQLPPTLSCELLIGYYNNSWLDTVDEIAERFTRESEKDLHQLVRLLESWVECVDRVLKIKDRITTERAKCLAMGDNLWKLETKDVKWEARCDLVVKRNYSYVEAVLDVSGARHLDECVREVETAVEKLVECEYEHVVSEVLVESCLGLVASTNELTQIREALTTLFHFLRRPLTQSGCHSRLHRWILFLGSVVTDLGGPDDRLFMMWQILHAPAGVSEWATSLIVPSDVDLSLPWLSMLLPVNDNDRSEDSGLLVDSEGIETDNSGPDLTESDLIILLDQVHVHAIFTSILGIEPGQSLKDRDIAARCCQYTIIMPVIAASYRIVDILSRALDHYDKSRYKTLHKTLNHIITESVQFVTDFLEMMLSISMTTTAQSNLSTETQLFLLAQYESVFEHALLGIISHRCHCGWQCLVDLPWRLLSPTRKTSLHRHLDPRQCPTSHDLDHTYNQITFLLTALSNLALQCRTSICTETALIASIVSIIFNHYYYHNQTITTVSDLARQLLASICIKHHQALSFILNEVRQYHASMHIDCLQLLSDLPIPIMLPSDDDFNLLKSWIMNELPDSLCNRLARHVLGHLNWGYGNCDQTVLYLPLSRHIWMADLLVCAYDEHCMSGNHDNTLWTNQMPTYEHSVHLWCIAMATRVRLHKAARPRIVVSDSDTEMIRELVKRHHNNILNPVAVYMTSLGSYLPDQLSLTALQSLIETHKHYRLALELMYNDIIVTPAKDLGNIGDNAAFMSLWGQLLHVDDKPGVSVALSEVIDVHVPDRPVLCYVCQSLCPSLMLAQVGEPIRDNQEAMMRFLVRLNLEQHNWIHDDPCLWLIDTLLSLDTAFHCQAGSSELYKATKSFTDQQLQDAEKKTGFFRSSKNLETLLDKIPMLSPVGELMWVKSYLLEAQARIEDDLGIWAMFLSKLLTDNKKTDHTVASAMSAARKKMKLVLRFDHRTLAVIRAAELLLQCPATNFAFIKMATVLFVRCLGRPGVWEVSLAGYGSAGHAIFKDSTLSTLLVDFRERFRSFKTAISSQISVMLQNEDTDSEQRDELRNLGEMLETFILWIDEPRLHLAKFQLSKLPPQYRYRLLEQVKAGHISAGDFRFPTSVIVSQSRVSASQWTCRHDIDLKYFRLWSEAQICDPRHNRHSGLLPPLQAPISQDSVTMCSTEMYRCPEIPAQALSDSDFMMDFMATYFSELSHCEDQFILTRARLLDLDSQYLEVVTHYYERIMMTDTIDQGAPCSGDVDIHRDYESWVMRDKAEMDMNRIRRDLDQLLDDMVCSSGSLDAVVKCEVCVYYLVRHMNQRLRGGGGGGGGSDGDDDYLRRLNQCGMTLYFHIGNRIDHPAQAYPPHRSMVSKCLQSIGTIFSNHMGSYTQRLLQGMLEKEQLVEIYGEHFNPNTDCMSAPSMYAQVVTAMQYSACSSEVASVILSKFNMSHFLANVTHASTLVSMVSALCEGLAVGPSIHGDYLVLVLKNHLDKCLPTVLAMYLKMCQDSTLGSHHWVLLSRSVMAYIELHGELSLATEDIKKEVLLLGEWLASARWSHMMNNKEGLYLRYGDHARGINTFYGTMLSSLLFKMARVASEDLVSWPQVINDGWDLMMKVYGAWLQPLPSSRPNNEDNGSPPWREQDKDTAYQVSELLMDQINDFLVIIESIDGTNLPRLLLHQVLHWLVTDLLAYRQLLTSVHYEVYCTSIIRIHWHKLVPNDETVTIILEFLSGSCLTDQSMTLMVAVTSRLCWSKIVSTNDSSMMMRVFNILVHIVCKVKSIFKMEAMESLVDSMMIMQWGALCVADYREGMTQLCDHLPPRVVLVNVSNIEGKLIKLLGKMASESSGVVWGPSVEKVAIYISTVATLLLASLTSLGIRQDWDNDGLTGMTNDGQVTLVNLLSEIETIAGRVTDMALARELARSMLLEMLVLFRDSATSAYTLPTVVDWIRLSPTSILIVPFLEALYQGTVHIVSMVTLAHELIQVHLLSKDNASWTVVTGCARLNTETKQEYLRESVLHNCTLCLVQQVLIALPLVNHSTSGPWLSLIVQWLENMNPDRPVLEHAVTMLVFLYLQMFLASVVANPRPGPSFEALIAVLQSLSGRDISPELGVLTRSMAVFLQSQLPSNNLVRTMPHQPGGLSRPGLSLKSTSPLPGQPVPTSKTIFSLESLKTLRKSQSSPVIKNALEMAVQYTCEPGHSVMDSVSLLALLCGRLWPGHRLLALVHGGRSPPA